MIEKIKQTADYIRSKAGNVPETAIILGTGLGALVDHITEKKIYSYTEIPNFPVSTVEGHSGNLIFGRLGNRQVIAMQGRFHYYEGYDMKEVTFPVRVMKQLGVKTLFVKQCSRRNEQGIPCGRHHDHHRSYQSVSGESSSRKNYENSAHVSRP